MFDTASANPIVSRRGEPVWEIAELFPEQGSWTAEDYLALDTNRLVEFDNGMIEVLPVPKKIHQRIILFLVKIFGAFFQVKVPGGVVLIAGYKVRIPNGRYREPDVLFLTAEQDAQSNEDFTDHAELVVEVVSPTHPERDYVAKRDDYALAGIPEYWIVDQLEEHIVVLKLENGSYTEHARFTAGQQASSYRFPGLSVAVDDVLKFGK